MSNHSNPVAKKAYKPTASMLQVLKWINAGFGPHHCCYGLSQHGGRSTVLMALYRRGYIDKDYRLTPEGKQLLPQ